MNSKVSVIIPVYNCEKYIEECIESIRNQTWDDYEVVIVDDGSTDKSPNICEQKASEDSRISFLRMNHSGVSAARNAGMAAATGDYIFFLDGDDCIDSELLCELISKMQQNDAELGISLIRKFGTRVERLIAPNEECNTGIIASNAIVHSFCTGTVRGFNALGGKMISRSLVGNVSFREDISSGEDTLFLYELVLKRPIAIVSEDNFYNYRYHDENTVSNLNVKKINDFYYVYKSLYKMESEAGREEESKYWYNSLIRWMVEQLGRKRVLQKKEERKLLKRKLSELMKDPKYTTVPRKTKLILFLESCPINFYDALTHDVGACCGCGACADICPLNCISMNMRKDGFYYPSIDLSKCTNCGLCDRICPSKAEYGVGRKPDCYALQAKTEVRKLSTSGGAFRLLAEDVLKCGGVVIGAALVDNVVKHIVTENIEQLNRLNGSKYVQSNTQGIFSITKKLLEEGREVLFSGTPCQIEALRKYLGKNYENLLLVDLICNGVASPGIWDKYVHILEKKYKGHMTDFKFRDKRNADDGHTVSASFGEEEHTWSIYSDPFCKTYFNGNNLRNQCRECRFCSERRNSDFTIGDYWGVEKTLPEWNDGMGTSLVLVHTPKAIEIMENLKNKAKVERVSEKTVRQPRLIYPFNLHRRSRLARFCLGKMPISHWLKEFGK